MFSFCKCLRPQTEATAAIAANIWGNANSTGPLKNVEQDHRVSRSQMNTLKESPMFKESDDMPYLKSYSASFEALSMAFINSSDWKI